MNDIVYQFDELDRLLTPGNKESLTRIMSGEFVVEIFDGIFVKALVKTKTTNMVVSREKNDGFYIIIKSMVYIGHLCKNKKSFLRQDRMKFPEDIEGALVAGNKETEIFIDLSEQNWINMSDDIIRLVRKSVCVSIKQAAKTIVNFISTSLLQFLSTENISIEEDYDDLFEIESEELDKNPFSDKVMERIKQKKNDTVLKRGVWAESYEDIELEKNTENKKEEERLKLIEEAKERTSSVTRYVLSRRAGLSNDENDVHMVNMGEDYTDIVEEEDSEENDGEKKKSK